MDHDVTNKSPKRIRRWHRFGAMTAIALALTAGLLNHAGCCAPTRPTARSAMSPGDLLAGHWEGTWSSTMRDMGGKLTCEVRRLEAGRYNADFHAIYARVLTNDSSVTLQASKGSDRWQFEGQKDLGIMSGGVYTYKGYVTADEFYSTYDSRYDKGIFRMQRGNPASQPAVKGKTRATSRPN